ncbi:MAG: hypothetical protein A2802_02725 [Candidatus Woykebacteria bacterium RIFCSPHIGHO2_01_FULL_43_29]|uniref:LamG-like jellyroll fold domain-containing protein n=2 Tax=Candidatus Woykeibacteriota TaxID=1817899 RepID=A0A1G1WY54_9BACT|nr:MAG: hypothetical protein A2802_02725 [Candidatus Woykebacteria bacterium RIFCSPHIGHO2_01_FULL_43_29]OGY29830.1 MAG: hypothetical protein A3J50_04440 [Candidatus Woykebacteria bacterium RIFCSPHIGHO2_02_FULL_43_16b]OGY32659.1 MAG: hypothetical protein A3A61_04180 [Candidatus Woykebacteria bacterium RIFCSPLOWO2_01_FULL_43_14]
MKKLFLGLAQNLIERARNASEDGVVRFGITGFHYLIKRLREIKWLAPSRRVRLVSVFLSLATLLAFPFADRYLALNLRYLYADYHAITLSSSKDYIYETTNKDLAAYFGDKNYPKSHRFGVNINTSKLDIRLTNGESKCPENPDGCNKTPTDPKLGIASSSVLDLADQTKNASESAETTTDFGTVSPEVLGVRDDPGLLSEDLLTSDPKGIEVKSAELIENQGFNDQFVYLESKDNLDLHIVYEIVEKGVKQTITLPQNSLAKHQFLLSLEDLQVIKVATNRYIFSDKEGKAIIQLSSPKVLDNSGQQGSVSINIFQEPRGVIMELGVDQDWFSDSKRAFPLSIELSFEVVSTDDPSVKKVNEVLENITLSDLTPLKITDGVHGDYLYENVNTSFQVGFGSKERGKTQFAFSDMVASGSADIAMRLIEESPQVSVRKNTKLTNEDDLKKDLEILGLEDLSHTSLVSSESGDEASSGTEKQILVDSVEVGKAQDQLDIEYKVFPMGVKEDIILNSVPANLKGDYRVEYALTTKGVVPKKDKNGLWSFYSNNDENKSIKQVKSPLFHFASPYMGDLVGVVSPNVYLDIVPYGQCDKHLKFDGTLGCYKITISADREWLLSPNRVYPVVIDPTIVDDTQAEFDAGAKNRIISSSTPTLQTNYKELARYLDTRAMWHLNETSGTVVTDGSGNSNTGTSSNMSFNTTTQRVGAASYTFNGTTSSISVADSPTLDFSDRDNWTIELWAKHNGAIATNEDYLLTKADTTTGGYKVYMDASGDFCAAIDDDSSWTPDDSACTSGLDYDDSLWHHVAVVRNKKSAQGIHQLRLYVDGVEVADDGAVAASNTLENGNSLYIGVDRDGTSNEWDGDIDEVRIVGSALTGDEIRADAQLFSYGIFNSSVSDLTCNVSAVSTVSWSESGVKTGDGETLSSATSLVAQWNFNETSGTTAAVAAGSCGTTCNMTLNNFASTGSQDAAAQSGWTADNLRWGAGGLMLSDVATADNLSLSDPASNNLDPNSADLSFETWVKTSDVSVSIFSNNNANGTSCTNNGYSIGMNGSGFPIFNLDTDGATAGCDVSITGTTKVADSDWHHLAVSVTRGTSATMYLDGVAVGSDSSVTSYSSITVTGTVYFGGSAGGLLGILDSTRMYARAITAAEVLSNYNAGNIDFQTRTGTTSSPDSTWEAWKPVTSETQLASMDGAYLYSTSETSTVSYWPIDETSASTANDATGSNTGTATGTNITDGKFGKARGFDGAGDFINVSDNATLDFAAADNFTAEAWVKHNTASAADYIVAKADGTSGGYKLWMDASGDFCFGVDDDGTWTPDDSACTSAVEYDDNVWHHVVGVKTGTTKIELFVDGISVASDASIAATGTLANTGRFYIGIDSDGSSSSWTGTIDEVRVFNAALSQATIQQHTYEGISRYGINTVNASTDTTIKYEGTGSEKISFGVPKIQNTTAGLWHLEETSGTTSYIKDASVNANNGTPTNTTVVNGYAGVARNFDGAGDFISVADNATLDFVAADNFTVEAWVKHNGTIATNNDYIVTKADGTTGGYKLYMDDSGDFCFAIDDDSTWTPGDSACTASIDFDDSLWHYVVGVKTGTTQIEIFVDGLQKGSDASIVETGTLANTGSLYIGIDSDGSSNSWDGVIDEVQVKRQAELPTQIWENYKSGRDHSVAKSVSSTDLSTSSKLPFYIAADRPGTYLQTSISETGFQDYEYEASNRGFWHLDNHTNTGSDSYYLKDSSGLLNNLTPTGTAVAPGKIGSGRYFDGVDSALACTDALCGGTSKLDYTGSGSWSFGAWVNLSSSLTYGGIISKWHDNGQNNRGYMIYYNSSCPCFSYNLSSDGITGDGGTSSITKPVANTWYLVVGVYDGATSKLYVNGVLEGSASFTAGIFNNAADFKLGCYSACSSGVNFRGIIDEPFVTTTALTAAQTRQMYEVGQRTHNVTIDFGATLDSGNLIADTNDLSFTVDATAYGATNKGDNLYKSDQMIVKENVNGTEYIAQGYVTAITASSGAVTVASWDAGSTFPSGGFTVAASVFKWQREFVDISGTTLTTDRDAVTRLMLRKTDIYPAANVWVDDIKYAGDYLTTSSGSSITSTAQRYAQYRAIFMSNGITAASASLTSATINYSTGVSMAILMRHGKYFNSSCSPAGEQPFWWAQ